MEHAVISVENICKNAITRFNVNGTPIVSDIVTAISRHYQKVQKYALWIFTDSDLSEYTQEDMQMIARCARKHAHHKKTACVGNDDLKYGSLRMYQAYAELNNVPSMLRVFRNEFDAIEWLQKEGV